MTARMSSKQSQRCPTQQTSIFLCRLEMFPLSLIEHFLIVDNLLRDKGQLVYIFLHLVGVKFSHFLKIHVYAIQLRQFYPFCLATHEIIYFCLDLPGLCFAALLTDLLAVCSLQLLRKCTSLQLFTQNLVLSH